MATAAEGARSVERGGGVAARPAQPLGRVLRTTFWAQMILVILAGMTLFGASTRTDHLFAWTIRPAVTAAFLGASYWATIAIESLALHARTWDFRKHRLLRMNRMMLGTGLVTSEGEFWRRQRRLVQPAFHRNRVAGDAEQMRRITEATLDSLRPDGPVAMTLSARRQPRRRSRLTGLDAQSPHNGQAAASAGTPAGERQQRPTCLSCGWIASVG